MGFFSTLKKALNPGGAVVSAVAGDNHNYIGPADYLINGSKNAQKNAEAQKQAQQDQYSNPRPAYTPAPNGLTRYPAMSLGWTNGGYNYAHGGVQNPMSFGGQPSQGVMTPSGPQGVQMGLPSQPSGGSMPPAGAPQPPTGPRINPINDPRVDLLRNGRAIM